MSDTIALPTVPAYVQTTGYGHNHGHRGLSDKDQMGLDKDVSNANFNNVINDLGIVGVNIEKNGAAGVLATSVAAGALGVAVEKTSAAGQLTTNVVGQQIQNLLISQANLASVQAQTFAASTNLAIEKIAAAALIDSTKNAGAAALTAAVNTAAIQAAIAECCCEQRELTRAEADKTRDLINSINTTNIQALLTTANAEIMLLKLKAPLVTS